MKNSNSTDDQTSEFRSLLLAARQGTADHRVALLNSFREYLRNVADETVGSAAIAQVSTSDLVDDTISIAQNGLDLCPAESHDEFKAWLRQILINDIMNRFRDLRRKKRDIGREQGLDSKLQLADDTESPSQQVIRKENELRLLNAMSRLSDHHRLVIELRQRDGLTFVEIAERLSRTPDSTRMLWNRAIDSLANILQDDAD